MTRLVMSPNRKIQIEIYGRNLKENFSDKIAFFKTDLSTPIRKSWMENIDFFLLFIKEIHSSKNSVEHVSPRISEKY